MSTISKLPDWALDAISESCNGNNWSVFIDEIYSKLKKSKNLGGRVLNNNKL